MARRTASRSDLIELWGFDAGSDQEILYAVIARLKRLPWPFKGAIVIAVLLVVLAIGDLIGLGWVNELGAQQIAVTVLSEAALVLIVFFVVDEAAERRARRAWDKPISSTISWLLNGAVSTRYAFDDAYADLDSQREWQQFQRSAQRFAQQVAQAQPMLTAAPDLAEVWTEFASLAREYEDLATADPEQIKAMIGEELFEQRRDRFRTRNIELIMRLDHYQEVWHQQMVADFLANPTPERYRRRGGSGAP